MNLIETLWQNATTRTVLTIVIELHILVLLFALFAGTKVLGTKGRDLVRRLLSGLKTFLVEYFPVGRAQTLHLASFLADKQRAAGWVGTIFVWVLSLLAFVLAAAAPVILLYWSYSSLAAANAHSAWLVRIGLLDAVIVAVVCLVLIKGVRRWVVARLDQYYFWSRKQGVRLGDKVSAGKAPRKILRWGCRVLVWTLWLLLVVGMCLIPIMGTSPARWVWLGIKWPVVNHLVFTLLSILGVVLSVVVVALVPVPGKIEARVKTFRSKSKERCVRVAKWLARRFPLTMGSGGGLYIWLLRLWRGGPAAPIAPTGTTPSPLDLRTPRQRRLLVVVGWMLSVLLPMGIISLLPVFPQGQPASITADPDADSDSVNADTTTPVPTTPMPSTPVPSTPVPSTPVPSTPVPSTPVPSTPVPSTPVPSTPVPSTPVPSTPVPSTPVPSTPVPSTPVPSTPVPSTPVPSTPVPSTPVPPRKSLHIELAREAAAEMKLATGKEDYWGIELQIRPDYVDSDVDGAIKLLNNSTEAIKAGLPGGYKTKLITRDSKTYLRLVPPGDTAGRSIKVVEAK